MFQKKPKFCIDCKFFKTSSKNTATCTHEKSFVRPSDWIVYGDASKFNVSNYVMCASMRHHRGKCGEKGKLWEAKDESKLSERLDVE